MAGLTSEGLEVKRLQEVIDDRITDTRNFFGVDAATTVNDVLGRALRIHAASEADLWELAEAVYNSFKPGLATGTALDDIVAYAGLTRFEAAPSTVSLLVSGDYNTSIPSQSYVDSSFTVNRFLISDSVTLDHNQASGCRFEVISSVDNTDYTVTVGGSTFTYTTGVGETTGDIASNLSALISGSSGFFSVVVNTTQVNLMYDDIFLARDITLSTNLSFRKITKLIDAESEEVGAISQPANTLDVIASPISGWDTVNNPLAASLGRLRETDPELRIRFAQSKELNARGTIDAIFSNLLAVVGVEEVQVYENVTNAVDSIGLPPKSFSAVIRGGNSQEIAETIWNVKPAGIESFGDVDVQVTDSQGLPHTISFARPVNVNVHIDITISAVENQTIPSNIDELIINALEVYFSENYSVGDDVVYSRLYTPINVSSGYQVDSLFIGTSASPTGTSNIIIAYNEIANFLRGNVSVTIN